MRKHEDEYIFTFENTRVRFENDFNPQDPRDFDNVGVMICGKHRHYDLGDEQRDLVDAADLLKEYGEGSVLLPLYLLDHSGLWMRTGSFECDPGGWDTSLVGIIVCPEEAVEEEFDGDREKAAEVLRAEVETYSAYLGGRVGGYIVEDMEGHALDSCWGYYDVDHLSSSGEKAGKYWNERFEQAEQNLAFALAL